MVKPKGTVGATKMKIMAIISYNCNHGDEAYGYNIWQCLKDYFHIYLKDCDVRNVYHHLKELSELGYLERMASLDEDPHNRCLYTLTDEGRGLENRYSPYLEIVERSTVSTKY
jgi:DNA-binding PadR family transcriptional regulator